VKILISAFGCAPGFGSEQGNGWNWSAALADAGHEVTVLTGPSRQSEIEAAMRDRPDRASRFIYIDVPRWAAAVKGQVGVYANYLAWQWAAYRLARRLVKREEFDLVHHVSWGSLQLGTWMGRLPVPLVFGPVGGGQTAPRSLRRFYAGDWRTEAIRTFVTERLMMLDPFARMTASRARLILVNNEETARLARRLGSANVRYASELGLTSDELRDIPSPPSGPPLRLLWVGRLMPRKGLPLALQAVALARRNADVHLTVVGDGPQSDDVRRWIDDLGIANAVDHRGRIPFAEVQVAYRTHDVLLFTSLRDSTGAQILEAMAAGLPVVALDQSGAAALIGTDRGLLVPVAEAQRTLQGFAAAIEQLARDPELLSRLGHEALRYAGSQVWPLRAAEMTAHYEAALGR
jgi:glycosyltransferase involved in cell wall biosynthesis